MSAADEFQKPSRVALVPVMSLRVRPARPGSHRGRSPGTGAVLPGPIPDRTGLLGLPRAYGATPGATGGLPAATAA
eukprot:764288-Hanusia_phi.AAC.3